MSLISNHALCEVWRGIGMSLVSNHQLCEVWERLLCDYERKIGRGLERSEFRLWFGSGRYVEWADLDWDVLWTFPAKCSWRDLEGAAAGLLRCGELRLAAGLGPCLVDLLVVYKHAQTGESYEFLIGGGKFESVLGVL